MITKETIAKINDAALVEDVVGEFVHLKKRGANMIGLCPFHDEKTPSFIVSPAKGIYKCFGCGQSGDSIKFIMEHEHYSYPQALRFLAEKYRIEIEEEELSQDQKDDADQKESLYIVLKYASEYFQDQLFNTDEGKSVGLSYFKERGFLEDTIRTFGLGFAPDSWDSLYQDSVKGGYNDELMEKAGLIKRKEDGKIFDFFRGRVMFPIHNVTGKVVAFGGRILKKNEKTAKYINTPETDVYHKSRIVYGIFQAKQEVRKLDETLLVEGYTDVISLYQAGIKNVVASSGTALTPEQVKLIRRFSPNITLLYDGDKAGIKAAIRGVDILLEEDTNVRVIILPEGEDPDSYLRKVGSTAFREYIEENKKDFVLFKMQLLLGKGKPDPIAKTEMIRDISASISRIRDAIKRSVYIKECSRLLEIDEKLLINEVNRIRRKDLADKSSKPYSRADDEDLAAVTTETTEPVRARWTNDFEPQERELVRLLLIYGNKEIENNGTVGSVIVSILGDEVTFSKGVYHAIFKKYRDAVRKKSDLDLIQSFRNHEDQEIREACLDILAPGREVSENWLKHEVIVRPFDDDLMIVAKKAAMRYKSKRLIEMLKTLDENLKTETDYDKQKELLTFRKKFDLAKNELLGELGTDIVY